MFKKSFWQKITGAIAYKEQEYAPEDGFEDFSYGYDEYEEERAEQSENEEEAKGAQDEYDEPAEDDDELELPVDIYQSSEQIVINAFIPGVPLDSLDIQLTREMISIKGARSSSFGPEPDEYFYKELFWGSFSRKIVLPEEIDVDAAEASEKNGVLTVILPKINKSKKTRLKVKSLKS